MDIREQLIKAVDGLRYPSETDAPFEVIEWLPARSAFHAIQDNASGWPIQQISVEDFFDELDDDADAARYVGLRKLLVNSLADLCVYRLGTGPRIDIYVVGRTDGGEWVGVKTVSVET